MSALAAPAIGGMYPREANTIPAALIPSPAQIDCLAIRIVRRLMSIPSIRRAGSSARSMTSAASVAIPRPCDASATPMVALLSAGASLVPSPIITTDSPS